MPHLLMGTGTSEHQTKTTVSVLSVRAPFFHFFCNPHLCLFPRMLTPPQQLHLNMFPYKASKYEQPIWSNSLKFIGP